MQRTLTAFADEVGPELSVQVDALVENGIQGLVVRSLNNINVLELTLNDLEQIQAECQDRGLHVSCVGSPVNKVPYHVMGRARELDRLRKACYAAARLNTKKIRLFTPEVAVAEHDDLAEMVIDWMREQKRVAADHGLVLLHENDGKYWGAYPENAKRLFGELGDETFRAAFDFANSTLQGFSVDDWFPWIIPYLDTLHLKDAIQKPPQVVPVGEGEGRIAETLSNLFEANWDGPLTVEPHLQQAGTMGGFTGPQLFGVAVNAVKKTVRAAGGEA
jgi:sugar phosphate isomerase/epimerase